MFPVPKGYRFGAAAAAFKREDRLDLGLMLSDRPAVAAGVFTTNKFQAAPVVQCRETLAQGKPCRAFLVNSGQANACTGDEGLVNCRVTLDMVSQAAQVSMDEILPASTGVIGAQLRMTRWKKAMPALAESLGKAGPMDVARAIMTTDTFPKVAWGRVEAGNDGSVEACRETGCGEVRLLGMAKGAGMISPNMATMLGFVICDAEVDPAWWQATLAECADQTFNRVTVDGDTSTNDCLLAMANGASGVRIESEGAREALREALMGVCRDLAYMIIQDAEGGTKVVRITVAGAADQAQAELAARAVGNSPLVKTALFGQDANWGRIVAAVGRSGADFAPDDLVLQIGQITVFKDGAPVAGDLDGLLAPVMKRQDIDIFVSLGQGPGEYTLLASDLTVDYIRINADYRS